MNQSNRNRVVSLFPTKAIPPPSGWAARKKRVWREVVGAFDAGYFRASDRCTLAAYIDALVLHADMAERIDREGPILTDANGRRYAHPACAIQNQAAVRIATLGSKLRVHASARMRSEDAFAAARKSPSSIRPPWGFDAHGDGDDDNPDSLDRRYFD